VGNVVSVNIASGVQPLPGIRVPSGIGKQPTGQPVTVRDPGPKGTGLGSGIVGDLIGDGRHHGGADQAVYAYSRESLDGWAAELGRPLRHGIFGENLTTAGIDVDGALLGERWQIGVSVVLVVTEPRIPCNTFRTWMNEPGWVKRFAAAGRPGTYLRVVVGGEIAAGDPIEIVHRPDHGVSVAMAFRALMHDRSLLPAVAAAAEDLTDELRATVSSGQTFSLDPE
jgi:MOSC domain-containing protein YiiM